MLISDISPLVYLIQREREAEREREREAERERAALSSSVITEHTGSSLLCTTKQFTIIN